MSFTIERATIEHLDDLLPLAAAYRTFYEQPQDSRLQAFLEANLRDERSAIFLARRDSGEALGFAQIFRTESTVRLGPSLILEDLFVRERARGAGIAQALLAQSLAYAREVGAVGMFLETAYDNVAARTAYERAGWTREGRFYKYNAPL